MGARIAAHFANAGVPSLLLDVNAGAVSAGIEAAQKQSPGAFFAEPGKSLITPGSFDEDLHRIGECDWVIEAVVENLDIKRSLWKKVDAARAAEAILSTNTSGIPLSSIAAGFSAAFQKRFLGTHFFNPPRYMHLLEVIPGPGTEAGLLDRVAEYAEITLGKGVVRCKDTPNFIANRIGSFFGATVAKLAEEQGLTVEEVDALTGPLIGLPRSASFRLLDIVGLDVWAFVSENLYSLVPDDPWRERFKAAPYMNEMLRRGWLGEKKKQGFYKRVGPKKEIHVLDLKTFEYHPAEKARIPGLDAAYAIEALDERLRYLVKDQGKAGRFLKPLFEDVIAYAEAMAPQIAHAPEDIDRAMQWGYNHALGPFAIKAALEGRAPAVSKGLRTVASNAGASLIDIGDGVAQLEFHSKVNALGQDAVEMMKVGLQELENAFEAMVIANDGEVFSAGANLALVLMLAQDGDWDELDLAIRQMQGTFMAMKYAPRPVVAAPHSRALGGGCEVILHCRGVQAHAELYMGLVEIGIGAIPAAGGCKEMIARLKDPRRAFELIGLAKVSTSADNAKELGLLDRGAGVTMNRRRLLEDAKATALALARSYRPGVPRSDIKVGGDPAFAALRMGAWLMREAGHISNHDFAIAEKLARVLTGGVSPGERTVSEQHLLDLEREAFLGLCGTRETQERMAHMLKTGKPLRN